MEFKIGQKVKFNPGALEKNNPPDSFPFLKTTIMTIKVIQEGTDYPYRCEWVYDGEDCDETNEEKEMMSGSFSWDELLEISYELKLDFT